MAATGNTIEEREQRRIPSGGLRRKRSQEEDIDNDNAVESSAGQQTQDHTSESRGSSIREDSKDKSRPPSHRQPNGHPTTKMIQGAHNGVTVEVASHQTGDKSSRPGSAAEDVEASQKSDEPPQTPDLRTLARTFDGSTPTSDQDYDQNGIYDASRSRTDSQSTGITNGTQRSSSISSMVFIISGLEAIAASKEARKRKQLEDSVRKALSAIKESDPKLPDAEIIFEPLQFAILTNNVALATTALDCIGKLISYSYFYVPRKVSQKQAGESQATVPLIERAIDTIIDCFQGESTPVEIQLQILKSLLAAVLNDKIIVHGAGLLKTVRQTYNIFLLSKSSANQQVAQGTLTQMVGTVFERLKSRLVLKEARLNLARISSAKSAESRSQVTVNIQEAANGHSESDLDGEAPETPPTPALESAPNAEPQERITLQSFENRKSFDDERIQDSAPTLVTRASSNQQSFQKLSNSVEKMTGGHDDAKTVASAEEEDDEDEIYIKDAFLVFRAMCKLSIKTLPPDQLLDLKSHGMRSKLLSLHLVHTILNNHMAVFTSPLATIRASGSDEVSTFLDATKQYLCLSLSRNGASSVSRVFEVGCEIFCLMLKNMRVMLKVRRPKGQVS